MIRSIRSLARYPRTSLAVMVAVTLTALSGITRITFDGSLASLSVSDDPARIFNEQVRREFGDEEIGIALLEGDDVYSVENVTVLRALTDRLAEVDGVTRTLSITNASDPVADVFNPPPLLAPGPITAAGLAALRDRVHANPIYVPNLVAADGKAAAVTVFFENAVTTDDEAAVERDVQAVLDEYRVGRKIRYTGMSHIRVQAVERMQSDLLDFLPASLALMAVVLFGIFRSVRATLLPLAALALDVGCLVGLMGWFGEPITLATLVLPSLLLVIGGSYAIHIVDAYMELVRKPESAALTSEQIFGSVLGAVGLPVSVSALTNAIGFGSLAIHPIPAIAGLGKFAVLGIAVVTVGCVLGIPLALLSMPGRRALPAPAGGEPAPSPAPDDANEGRAHQPPRLERAVARLGGVCVDHRMKVLAGAAFLTLLAAYGAMRVKVDTDFLMAFREGSEIRESFSVIQQKLAGPNPISVVIQGPEPGYFRDITAIRRVKDFQIFAEGLRGVDESLSLVDYLDELDLGLQQAGGEMILNEATGEIIESPPPKSFWESPDKQLPQVLQLVSANPRSFSGVVDRDFQRLHITLRTSLTGSLETSALVEQVKTYAAEAFPRGVDVQMTGTLVVMASISDRILQGQVESTVVAYGIIFIVLSVMFLSLRVGLMAMIPNVIPNVVFFGVMGFGGIELNLATSIIAAIALGVSVDDTVHYMARLNRVVKTTGTQREALLATLHIVSRPVIATTITLAAGFMVMTTSNFVIISTFGWLTALTMMVALLTNLFLVPAILATVPVISVWDLVSSRLGPSPHLTIPLFEGLGRLGVRLVVLLGRLRTFKSGEFVVRRGDEGREMYLVLTGSGQVLLDHGVNIPLPRGGIVGEMALLRRAPRGADVVASTELDALVIDEAFLRRLRIRYPRLASKFFLNIARILSDRLDVANRRV
ncbi:MAG: MMPL family transporter [Candidatus Binatia bacterium]